MEQAGPPRDRSRSRDKPSTGSLVADAAAAISNAAAGSAAPPFSPIPATEITTGDLGLAPAAMSTMPAANSTAAPVAVGAGVGSMVGVDPLGYPSAVGSTALVAPGAAPPDANTGSLVHEIPSSKLGQLLGYKGLTIQRLKEISGVTRLHILEKEKAKFLPTIQIEIAGPMESVLSCKQLLEGVVAGDQTGLGHKTTYVSIEPSVVGKVMGYKGTTVKQMTEVTGCYVEIQQDRSRGAADTPRLFVAGPPEKVDSAVRLVELFIASPGSKLDAVLGQHGSLDGSMGGGMMPIANAPNSHSLHLPGQGDVNTTLSAFEASLAPPTVAFEPDGPKEERIIEIPSRKKGHLLGLHGQTIEKIRQTCGVIKCHIQADRSHNDKNGTIGVQIFGTKDRVEACIHIVQSVVNGNHSAIGHATDVMVIDPNKVNRLRGDRWQVINTLKDLTTCYLDILQGAEAGVPPGEARLFIAGPPQNVQRAKTIVQSLLMVMDRVPANGELNAQVLDSVLSSMGVSAGASRQLAGLPPLGMQANQRVQSPHSADRGLVAQAAAQARAAQSAQTPQMGLVAQAAAQARAAQAFQPMQAQPHTASNMFLAPPAGTQSAGGMTGYDFPAATPNTGGPSYGATANGPSSYEMQASQTYGAPAAHAGYDAPATSFVAPPAYDSSQAPLGNYGAPAAPDYTMPAL